MIAECDMIFNEDRFKKDYLKASESSQHIRSSRNQRTVLTRVFTALYILQATLYLASNGDLPLSYVCGLSWLYVT